MGLPESRRMDKNGEDGTAASSDTSHLETTVSCRSPPSSSDPILVTSVPNREGL